MEFRACIRILAEKVNFLSRQRTELVDRCSTLESTNNKLSQEVADKKELVKNLYSKLQLEKQVNYPSPQFSLFFPFWGNSKSICWRQASKEKISFGRLEVHELAAFVLNAAGHYVAINRSHTNYYLSTESVALFVDHLPARPTYVTGQIVHIERQMVKMAGSVDQADVINSDCGGSSRLGSAPPNPYGLPPGCEYFIVTVAMLPDSVRPHTS